MKDTILVLHGWGLNRLKYDNLVQLLTGKKYTVYCVDLPGFGEEPLISKTMRLDDYVTFVHDFLQKKKVKKVVIIGHSFGGRVALKYAWEYPENIKSLVLTGVPIIRHTGETKQIAYYLSKIGGRILSSFPPQVKNVFRKGLYYSLGEWDYYKSGELQQVFKNIINEDILQYLQKVKVPVFLIWGKDDTITPASDLSLIKQIVPSVKYTIIPNTTHRLPYSNPEVFTNTMEKYL